MKKSRRRACDGCYIQKIRCVPPKTCLPSERPEEASCRQCQSLGIPCTFDRHIRRAARKAAPSVRQEILAPRPSSSLEEFGEVLSPSQEDTFPVPGNNPCSSRPLNYSGSPLVLEPATHSRESLWASFGLCSRETLDKLLNDYFLTLYTITPIIDRTPFQSYFSHPEACHVAEPEAFALALSVCAYYTSTYPRKFSDYQSHDLTLRLLSHRDFLYKCASFILSLRRLEYFEISTLEKCVTCYFMALTMGAIGLTGRAWLHIMETKYHIQQLGYDSPLVYRGLSAVQSELAKRTYWLYVVAELHEHVGLGEEHALWEPLPPGGLFRQEDFTFLTSLHHVTGTNPQEDGLVSTGLRYLIKLYMNFMRPDDVAECDETSSSSNVYELMRFRVEHALDDVPRALAFYRDCNSHYSTPNRGERDENGFNRASVVRVNLQVTRIWAKSLIFERLVLSKQELDLSFAHSAAVLATRIEIGEELLAFTETADMLSFEANSPSITYKIRRVATPLLRQCSGGQQSLATHASEVLRKILSFLGDLNRFSLQDSQYLEGIEKYQSL
ncbi:hypothetical protein BJY01DRAFT_217939 [Aspergillus pseudoustus]|uniref:Zn(2)-C6 fungal-type domain-containing protein n=1 Tax=Aspergillus pseudoustus TaxID=1810923 RepID=A0ABR4JLV2_9EURO